MDSCLLNDLRHTIHGKENDERISADETRISKMDTFSWIYTSDLLSVEKNPPFMAQIMKKFKDSFNIINLNSSNLNSRINNCYEKPLKVVKLKESIQQTLICILWFQRVLSEDSILSSHFEIVSELLALYIDLELKASKRGRETYDDIISRIITFLRLYFNESAEHMFDTLLKMRHMNQQFNQVIDPIVRKIVNTYAMCPRDEIMYLRYFLIFRLWKSINNDGAVRKQIKETAIAILGSSVPPVLPPFFMKYFSSINLQSRSTKTFLKQKMDLKSCCSDFFRFRKQEIECSSGIQERMLHQELSRDYMIGNTKVSESVLVGVNNSHSCQKIHNSDNIDILVKNDVENMSNLTSRLSEKIVVNENMNKSNDKSNELPRSLIRKKIRKSSDIIIIDIADDYSSPKIIRKRTQKYFSWMEDMKKHKLNRSDSEGVNKNDKHETEIVSSTTSPAIEILQSMLLVTEDEELHRIESDLCSFLATSIAFECAQSISEPNLCTDDAQTISELNSSFDSVHTISELKRCFDSSQTISELNSSFDNAQTISELNNSFDSAQTISELNNSLDNAQTISKLNNSLDNAQTISELNNSLDNAQTISELNNSLDNGQTISLTKNDSDNSQSFNNSKKNSDNVHSISNVKERSDDLINRTNLIQDVSSTVWAQEIISRSPEYVISNNFTETASSNNNISEDLLSTENQDFIRPDISSQKHWQLSSNNLNNQQSYSDDLGAKKPLYLEEKSGLSSEEECQLSAEYKSGFILDETFESTSNEIFWNISRNSKEFTSESDNFDVEQLLNFNQDSIYDESMENLSLLASVSQQVAAQTINSTSYTIKVKDYTRLSCSLEDDNEKKFANNTSNFINKSEIILSDNSDKKNMEHAAVQATDTLNKVEDLCQSSKYNKSAILSGETVVLKQKSPYSNIYVIDKALENKISEDEDYNRNIDENNEQVSCDSISFCANCQANKINPTGISHCSSHNCDVVTHRHPYVYPSPEPPQSSYIDESSYFISQHSTVQCSSVQEFGVIKNELKSTKLLYDDKLVPEIENNSKSKHLDDISIKLSTRSKYQSELENKLPLKKRLKSLTAFIDPYSVKSEVTEKCNRAPSVSDNIKLKLEDNHKMPDSGATVNLDSDKKLVSLKKKQSSKSIYNTLDDCSVHQRVIERCSDNEVMPYEQSQSPARKSRKSGAKPARTSQRNVPKVNYNYNEFDREWNFSIDVKRKRKNNNR